MTEDDVDEIKHDISALRYELLDVFRANSMKLPSAHLHRQSSKRRGGKLRQRNTLSRLLESQSSSYSFDAEDDDDVNANHGTDIAGMGNVVGNGSAPCADEDRGAANSAFTGEDQQRDEHQPVANDKSRVETVTADVNPSPDDNNTGKVPPEQRSLWKRVSFVGDVRGSCAAQSGSDAADTSAQLDSIQELASDNAKPEKKSRFSFKSSKK